MLRLRRFPPTSPRLRSSEAAPLLALVLALAVAVAFVTAGPAGAADASLDAFLDGLAADVEAQPMSPCSVSLTCSGGSTISCTGTTSCIANDTGGYVDCDGSRTYCSGTGDSCSVSIDCSGYCGCSNCSFCKVQCYSSSGNCSQSGWSVTCDGSTLTCDLRCEGPTCSGPLRP